MNLILASLTVITGVAYCGHSPNTTPASLSLNTEPVKMVSISKESDLECLAKNVYYEAAFESYKGKQAIAEVTVNRLKTGRWGKTICDVVYAPYQFSWTLKSDLSKPHGKEWTQSVLVAHSFLVDGVRLKSLKGSIMYHADYIPTPVWASKKYRVAQIGQHIFYKKDVISKKS